MKKYFLMAFAAVLLMTQFADAGLLARLRAHARIPGRAPGSRRSGYNEQAGPDHNHTGPRAGAHHTDDAPAGAAGQVATSNLCVLKSVLGHESYRPRHALFIPLGGDRRAVAGPYAHAACRAASALG